MSLRLRLFCSFALITALAAFLPALLSRGVLYNERLALVEEQALAQAVFLGKILASSSDEGQEKNALAAADALALRITVTDQAGWVLLDSHLSAEALASLDNHADRPEIAAALSSGRGLSVRRGNSLGLEAVYAAAAMPDGRVLRVAVPLADIQRGLEKEFAAISLSIAGVMALCLLLSAFIISRVRRGVEDMAEVVGAVSRQAGQRRLYFVPGREFLPLAWAVNLMADSLEEHVRALTEQRCQLEGILETMREGVLVLDQAGRIRRWNKALALMFKDTALAEGRRLIEGIPSPALQRVVDDFLAAEPEEERAGKNAQFECPAGRFLLAGLSRPARPSAGLGLVLVLYDATEITRLERVRRDFVANVSHELRTPLAVMAGYAETLMSAPDLPETYQNFAAVIHKHASALARVAHSLLELARAENLHETVEIGPAEAGEALESAIAACRAQAEAKGARFSVRLAPARVLANIPLLAQVFRNLLENACRYSPEGGELRVTSSLLSGETGREVMFMVADDGPGIPPEDLPRVFERFYQVHKERNSGAAGIGLAICKHIIERHGGRIWAESPCGEAATAVCFTLPLFLPAETACRE